MENTRIISLEVSNVLRLTAVRITPDRNWVEIRGANAAGKSSLINSVAMLFGGKALCPDEVIRRGAERGQVRAELENLVITRSWKGEQSKVVVTNRDGAVYRSPQKLLTELWDRMTCDPLGFLRMDRHEQLRVALAVQGLTDQMAASLADEKLAMERRREVAASVKQLEAQIKGIVVPEGTPEDEVDVVQISTDLRAAEATIEDHNIEESALDNLRAVTIRMKDAVADEEQSLVRAETELDEMIQRAKDRMDEIRTAIAGNKAVIDTQQTEYNQRLDAWTPFEWPETAALEAKLASANKVNADVSKLRQRGGMKAGLAVTRGTLDDAEAAVSKIRLDRKAMLVGIDLPVKGLGYDADGVTLDGLPFDQASSAHQLRASVGMAMKMNPELRVLLIRDGSLLDDVQLAALHQQITDTDYQLWIERVGTDGGPAEVVIEDGHVQGSNDVACSACSKIIPRAEAESTLGHTKVGVYPIYCHECGKAAHDAADEQAGEGDAEAQTHQPTPGSEEMDADPVGPDLADGPAVVR